MPHERERHPTRRGTGYAPSQRSRHLGLREIRLLANLARRHRSVNDGGAVDLRMGERLVEEANQIIAALGVDERYGRMGMRRPTGGCRHATGSGCAAQASESSSDSGRSSVSRCIGRKSWSFSRPAVAFDSTMWASLATGITTPSTSKSRRADQTVSKSTPLITSDRSVSVRRSSLARVNARRPTTARARAVSPGISRGSAPANKANPLTSHACHAANRLSGSAGSRSPACHE